MKRGYTSSELIEYCHQLGFPGNISESMFADEISKMFGYAGNKRQVIRKFLELRPAIVGRIPWKSGDGHYRKKDTDNFGVETPKETTAPKKIKPTIIVKRKKEVCHPSVANVIEPSKEVKTNRFIDNYKGDPFFISKAWRHIRYQALKQHGAQCQCCGATRKDGIQLLVDHIKPRSKFPELALVLENLQVLCEDCNLGKSNTDETDWRT